MKKFVITLLLSLLTVTSYASTNTGVSLTRGFNGVDDMNGFALGYKVFWGPITNINNNIELTGLWDFGLAYWHSNKSKNTKYSNITIFSLMPVLRLQRKFAYDNGISPFADLGYGIALLNRDQFSNQQLGGYGSFIVSVGAGINFGPQSQYDLSYHYKMYNNAEQFKQDDGLYLNTISFTYHFAQ